MSLWFGKVLCRTCISRQSRVAGQCWLQQPWWDEAQAEDTSSLSAPPPAAPWGPPQSTNQTGLFRSAESTGNPGEETGRWEKGITYQFYINTDWALTLRKNPVRSAPLLSFRAPIKAMNVERRTSSGTGKSALMLRSSTPRFRATWDTVAALVRFPTMLSTPTTGSLGKLALHQSLRKLLAKRSPLFLSWTLSFRDRAVLSESTPSCSLLSRSARR